MAVLDDILNAQQAQQNQGLALAAHGAAWANFFNSTPTADKLRENLNLTNMVSDAVRKKGDLLAQTDLKAAEIRATNARHDEFVKQAPLREQLLRAHVEATGAAERRKTVEDTMRANDTTALNNDVAAAYRAGVKPGTPAFQDAVFSSIAKNPHADPVHIREVHKLAGGTDDVDPVAFAAEGMAMKEAARNAGLKNPRLRNASGKWVVDESPDVVTAEQKTADAVARAKALQAAKPAAELTPKQAGFLGRYAAPVSGLTAAKPILEKAGVDANAVWDETTSSNNLGAAVKAGKISQQEADTAAKAIDKFKKAAGKSAGKKDPDFQSHFDEVSAEVHALQGATSPAGAGNEPPKAPGADVSAPGADDFHSPDEFKAAFTAAPPGAVLNYKGKPYTKPAQP